MDFMSESPKQFSILGLPVHVMSDYTCWLLERLQAKIGTHVVTINAEMTMQAEQDPFLAEVIKNADLVIPDGAGVVLYLQLLVWQKVHRTPGIELAEILLQKLEKLDSNTKVFFYGGAPDIASKAAKYWQAQIPSLENIDSYCGYHSPQEEEELRQKLIKIQPQVIFVGLGVPRQELWITRNRHLCPEAIWMGVGGSFDIWSGNKNRAPAWLGNNHLEWLYRLYQEPWRWRRMLALPQFAIKSIIYSLTSIGAIG